MAKRRKGRMPAALKAYWAAKRAGRSKPRSRSGVTMGKKGKGRSVYKRLKAKFHRRHKLKLEERFAKPLQYVVAPALGAGVAVKVALAADPATGHPTLGIAADRVMKGDYPGAMDAMAVWPDAVLAQLPIIAPLVITAAVAGYAGKKLRT